MPMNHLKYHKSNVILVIYMDRAGLFFSRWELKKRDTKIQIILMNRLKYHKI